jgi:hypothetical protein
MARDPILVAAARMAAAHVNGEKAFPNAGRLNLYQCQHDAAHVIVTVDREPGVTPFTIQCPHCEAIGTPGGFPYKHPAMRSGFYRVSPNLTPTHEWYRPDSLEGFSAGMVDHLSRGGLVLRPITRATAEPAP